MRRGVPLVCCVAGELQKKLDYTAHPASSWKTDQVPDGSAHRELESPQSGWTWMFWTTAAGVEFVGANYPGICGHVLWLRERHPARGCRTLPAAPPFRWCIRGSRLLMRRAVDPLMPEDRIVFSKEPPERSCQPGEAPRLPHPIFMDDGQPAVHFSFWLHLLSTLPTPRMCKEAIDATGAGVLASAQSRLWTRRCWSSILHGFFRVRCR